MDKTMQEDQSMVGSSSTTSFDQISKVSHHHCTYHFTFLSKCEGVNHGSLKPEVKAIRFLLLAAILKVHYVLF